MSVFFILAIIFVAIFLVALIIGLAIDEPGVAAFGLVFLVIGALCAVGGAAESESKFNQETVKICEQRGGVVTKDNHCFKNDKPIEFEPGVWQRNW